MLHVWQLGHVIRLLHIVVDPPLHDVLFQSHPKIRCAYAGVDDCKNDQDNRDSGETRQTLPDGFVVSFMAGLVHSGQLEDEVCQSAEEEEDGDDHSKLVLAAGPESGHEENEHCHGDGGDC